MPALASPSTWRTKPYSSNVYAYVLAPSTIFSCSVNQAILTEPQANIIYDTVTVGAYTDVKPGMKVRIKNSSGVLKGYGYARASFTSTLLKLVPISFGDIILADNDIIEVLDLFEPHARPPYISPTSGTNFKNYDVVFNASTAQPPVANPGVWYAKRLNGAASINVVLDGTGSFAVASGATISSYSWNIVDGSVVSGSLTSSTLTASFPEGYRWVSLTVTDSNSNTHTACKLVVTTDNPTRVEVSRLGGSLDAGWECSLVLYEDDVSDYPPGTAVIVWAEERYGSTAGSLNGISNHEHVRFAGWTVDELNTIEPYRSDYTINAKNIKAIAGEIAGFSQTTLYSASPSSWYDVANHNMWRHLHYVLHWHTNLFEVAEVERPSWYDSYSATGLDADAVPVGEQLNFMAQAVRAKFTGDHNGRMLFRYDPHLMTDSERTALTTIVTLADTDWAEALDIEVRHRPKVGSLTASAIVPSTSSITTVLAGTPGSMPGQGVGRETLDRQLADQDDIVNRCKRLYTKLNTSKPSFPIQIMHGGLVADPAWQEWVKFTLAPTSNKREISYTSQRFTLEEMEVVYEHETGVSRETWTVWEVASDSAGLALPIVVPGADPPTSGDYIPSDGTWEEQEPYDYDLTFPEPYVPESTEPGAESIALFVWGDDFDPWITNDWSVGSPDYEKIDLSPTDGGNIDFAALVRQSNAIYFWKHSDGLWYSPNVRTTTPTRIYVAAGSEVWVLRATAAGGCVVRLDDSNHSVRYWNGSSLSAAQATLTAAAYPAARKHLDVDDFDLGIVVVGANDQVRVATSYSGTFTTVTGLTGTGGGFFHEVTEIRIPYLKFSGSLNNDPTALDIVYSIYGRTVHRATINCVTAAVVSQTTITPAFESISDWGIHISEAGFDRGTFETYGGNANRMIGAFRNSNSGSAITRLGSSLNAGGAWTNLGDPYTNTYRHLFFVPPYDGGNGNKVWMATTGGIFRSTDLGANWVDKSGDLISTHGITPRGVLVLHD